MAGQRPRAAQPGRRRSGGRAGVRSKASRGESLVDVELELDIGSVAHGGHCVARHEGRVVFVRHALPGERVRAVVTEGDAGSKFLRADATEVLQAAASRVEAPCPYAGECGGCDFQHASLPAQRALKAAVVAEQLRRVAGLEREVVVEEVPGASDGLGWRTRMQYALDGAGRPGLRRHRSREVVVLDDRGPCRIAHPELPAPGVRSGAGGVEAVVSSIGEQALVVHPVRGGAVVEGPERLTERVRLGSRDQAFTVATRGFWQVHPGAATTLATVVAELADVRPGETVLDLYAGVGLFSVQATRAAGEAGQVVAVEGEPRASDAARENAPGAKVLTSDVAVALASGEVPAFADVVILDPPRTGARRAVVEGIVARRPRVVVLVACDPGALARDVAIFAESGYELDVLRAYDLFPMTHHVECVALLTTTGSDLG